MKQHMMFVLALLSLLFWGWQTDVLWLGGLLAFILGGVYFKRGTYDFETTSFHHTANLCALIVAVIFALYWLDERASKAILPTVGLLPLALLPLLWIQYLHNTNTIPSSALLFFQRNTTPHTWFDVSSLFVFTCLFSAGAVVHQGLFYFAGVSAILLALLLVQQQHKQAKLGLLLVGMFLLAEVLGLAVIYGAQQGQKHLENRFQAWLLAYNDGNKASTAIGEVGRLKMSNAIVFRVKTDVSTTNPMLLLEGTYQRYRGQTWFGGAWQDKVVPFVDETWRLREAVTGWDAVAAQEETQDKLRMFQSLEQDKHTLILPSGATFIQGLDVASLKQTQGGRFEARGLSPFVAYDVYYQAETIFGGGVKRSDLDIPKHEAEVVAQFAKQHNLYRIKQEQGATKAIEVLHQVFLRDFMYVTWLQESRQQHDKPQSPLARFLLAHKQGHCEYFATATVLILRELGIPARYALGYNMSEHDASNDMFVVRGRDAHAWAVAQVDGQWVNADNTPPNWFAIENGQQSQLQGLWDWFSDINFAFKKWRYDDSEIDKTWWFALLLVLFVYLAVRVLRRVNAQSIETSEEKQVDEDWLRLEHRLADAGLGRKTGETVGVWLPRIEHGRWKILGGLFNQQHYANHGLSEKQQQVWDKELQDIEAFCDQLKARA